MGGTDNLIALIPHPLVIDETPIMYRAGQIRSLFATLAERDVQIERMKAEINFWQARAEAGDDLTTRLTETQHHHVAEISRLEERCAAYKGQVEAGADEIERLTELDAKRTVQVIELLDRATTAERERDEARAEVERLRPTVVFLAQTANYFDGTPDDHIAYVSVGTLRRARAALRPNGGDDVEG